MAVKMTATITKLVVLTPHAILESLGLLVSLAETSFLKVFKPKYIFKPNRMFRITRWVLRWLTQSLS